MRRMEEHEKLVLGTNFQVPTIITFSGNGFCYILGRRGEGASLPFTGKMPTTKMLSIEFAQSLNLC